MTHHNDSSQRLITTTHHDDSSQRRGARVVVPSTRGGDDVFKRDVRGVLRHAHQRHGCCGARGGAQAMRRQMTSVLKPRDGPVLYTSRL
jgi:hypothetical protein